MNCISRFIKKILGIDIIQVFSLNAVATLVRMLTGMISIKVVAMIVGPAGIALMGQLSNFNSIISGFAKGGIESGIIKYVAEYKEDESQIKKLLSNSLKVVLYCSLIISLFLILGCLPLSDIIFNTSNYFYVFIVFGFTLVLFSLNGFLLSILNGYKRFRNYVIVNIIGTIIGLIYTVTIVSLFKLPGALINIVTYQSIALCVTIWVCRKEPWFNKSFFHEKIDKTILKKLFGFSLMSITASVMLPVSQLLLRGYVISNISAFEAGIWESVNRISSVYLSVITTAFSVYYLPRLSEITDPVELRKEIFRCYKVIIPILLVLLFSVYLFRHFIVWLLFTPDFYPMESLFSWQLAGDFMKIMSWLLSTIMVAKARIKMFVVTEVVFSLAFLILAYLFLQLNGIVGLIQGYLVNYIIYTIIMCYMFRGILIRK